MLSEWASLMDYDVPPLRGTTLSIAIVEIGTIIEAIIMPTSAKVV